MLHFFLDKDTLKAIKNTYYTYINYVDENGKRQQKTKTTGLPVKGNKGRANAIFLLANGFTLKDAQEWLGHADIATTANVYAHLDMSRKCVIASGFEGRFSQGTQT